MKTLSYFLIALIVVEMIRSGLAQESYNPTFIAGVIAGALALRYIQFHRKRPKIRARIHADKRRQRLKRNGGSHTLFEWEALKARYGYKCAICKRRARLTKDHIIPVSRGGSDYITNIQPACQSCNSRKGNRV